MATGEKSDEQIATAIEYKRVRNLSLWGAYSIHSQCIIIHTSAFS